VGKLLIVGTYGSDDPTRASMPFIVGSGGLERGHEVGIVLMGEAVYLLKDSVVDAVQGVGFPPLRGPFDTIIANGVPLYV
jgi:predicted peroxiredoxin